MTSHARRIARPRWEPEAVAWLQEYAPQMGFAKLVDRFGHAARQNAWKPRTSPALTMKLFDLGLETNRRVINLDTGEVYPAVKNAAKAVGRKPESIRTAIRGGGTCASYRWAYVDDLEDAA